MHNCFRSCFRRSPDDDGEQHDESSPLLDSGTPSLTGEYRGFSRSMGAVKLFFYHATIYYGSAVLGYSFLVDRFSIIDSLYLATVTFTTIGYGDLHPTTNPGWLFMMALATYGIVILGIFIGVAGETLIEWNEAVQEDRKKAVHREAVLGIGGVGINGGEAGPAAPEEPKIKSVWQSIVDVVILQLPMVALVLVFGLTIGYVEKWPFLESIYWVTISGYTIGYGDVSPSLPSTRLACCFFLPFAVAIFGQSLARIASAYMSRHHQRHEREFLNRTIKLCDIKNLDLDQNGKVDLSEFLRYMLVALQKVEKDDIEELVAAFERLDVDKSGFLSVNDLTHVRGSLQRSVQRISIVRHLDPSIVQHNSSDSTEQAQSQQPLA